MTEFTLDSFAKHCELLGAKATVADHLGRAAIATTLTAHIRDKFGDYNKLRPEGQPLAQSTQEQRVKKGFTPDEALLMTGELKHSIGWETIGPETIIGSDDPKAVYHELGGTRAGRPPQRSFLESSMHEIEPALHAEYAATFVDVMTKTK